MSAELELLKTISGTVTIIAATQDKHTDAISELGKNVAVSNTQIENIHKMGCAPGVSKVKAVHGRVDEVHERINNLQTSGVVSEQSNMKYTIVGSIVAGAIIVVGLLWKYA